MGRRLVYGGPFDLDLRSLLDNRRCVYKATDVSATISYAFGMLARSFAIDRGINAQIAIAFIPLSGAMIVAGGLYPLLIPFLLLPLFLSIKASSVRIKGVFGAEQEARNEAVMLAARLDTAVNNMSHGLCMFDVEGRLIFYNFNVVPLQCIRMNASRWGWTSTHFLL